jgi:hypothetical protein
MDKFLKGDIIYGRKNSDAFHPIIFLEDRDADFFIGCMLTSSNNFDSNILMKLEHFKKLNENGEEFELQFSNSHLVKAKLLKRNEWQPFRKIGELTSNGLIFVEGNIETEPEKLWEEFLADQ